MRIAVFDAHECQPPEIVQPEALPSLLTSETAVLWVDMIGPDAEDIRVMDEVFHFHPLAIEDTRNQRQRPKVEEYPGYLFTILNPVTWRDGEIDFAELDMFVGRNYIVTVHRGDESRVDEARARVEGLCSVQPMSAGYLLYVIVDSIVDSYFPVLDHIGDEIEALEDTIFLRPRSMHLERLFRLKRALSEIWRVSAQQRDMFSILMRENYALLSQESLRYYMRDVYDHLLRISDTVNTFRDMLSNGIDLYMSGVSNRLNQQVNRLTIITMGVGVLAVITGFYGMNFEQTWPPFGERWGVPFVLTLMIGTVLIFFTAVYYRRR